MTQRQRAIEAISKIPVRRSRVDDSGTVHFASCLCEDCRKIDAEKIIDIISASEFCGDPVRELVKRLLYLPLPQSSCLTETERELLRKIVEG